MFRDLAIYTIGKNKEQLKTIKEIFVIMIKDIQPYDINRSDKYIKLIQEILKDIII